MTVLASGAAAVPVGRLSLQPLTTAQVLDTVFAAIADGTGGRIATVNVEFLQRAEEDPVLARLYEESDLRVADGTPILWLARLAGTPLPERIAGSDLVWRFAERARDEHRRLFLLGGDDGVAAQAAAVLEQRYPGLEVVGWASPRVSSPPTAAEVDDLREQLTACAPDLVYCAFGTPKQEQLAAALGPMLPGAWWLGCGASLSFIAGHRHRAPAWVQATGMEWLHRTLQEPRRLGGRYLRRNLPFLVGATRRELAQRPRRR